MCSEVQNWAKLSQYVVGIRNTFDLVISASPENIHLNLLNNRVDLRLGVKSQCVKMERRETKMRAKIIRWKVFRIEIDSLVRTKTKSQKGFSNVRNLCIKFHKYLI